MWMAHNSKTSHSDWGWTESLAPLGGNNGNRVNATDKMVSAVNAWYSEKHKVDPNVPYQTYGHFMSIVLKNHDRVGLGIGVEAKADGCGNAYVTADYGMGKGLSFSPTTDFEKTPSRSEESCIKYIEARERRGKGYTYSIPVFHATTTAVAAKEYFINKKPVKHNYCTVL